MVSDAIEASSLNYAVDKVVPHNNIILKCERCGNHSHYYLKKDGLITCKSCFEKNVDTKILKHDRIYLLKNNISIIKNELVNFKNQSLSKKYTDFNNSFKQPNLSDKFKNFNN